MRLLIVEDNEELAQLLTQRLQAAGYETDFLMTAAEAQAAVTTTRYAAMVLDLGLPDGDGLSVLREIRRGEDPLPVLVLTPAGTRASNRKKLAAFSAAAGRFLQFPIGDRRCKRTRASVSNAGGNARPSLTNARQL